MNASIMSSLFRWHRRNLRFCGFFVRIAGRWSAHKDYLKRSGMKSIWRTATIRWWYISGICVRNWVNRLENQILSRLSGEWDTKLKNNYRKLKLSILLQTVFITALTVLVGRFILEYFIDGIYNDSFATGFLRILETFPVREETTTVVDWPRIGK
mgnify:FL=1